MKFNKNEFGWITKNESSSSSGGGLTTAQENKLNIAYNHSKEEHFSGDYNDLTNKPTNVSEFNNDANYASETYVNDKIDEAQLGGDSGTIDLSGYVTKEKGNANQITFADGQTFQAKLDNGTLKGDKGDIGAQGIQGERGLQGEKGDKGADGLTTSISLNGVTYTQENGVITLPNISSGGNIQPITQIEPQELDMPKVFFYGSSLPTTKDNVNLTMDYVSNTAKFSSFVKLKCQGTSSMSYAKKNFTVAMYSDEARATKLKKDFKGWGAQSKFCLKANYVDTTHTRNISGARIAYDMVASRPDSEFKQQLLTAPRNGAVDGFPIKLYFNGEFYGIYTWNIPKDGWMFNMDKNNPNHVVLCAERNTDGNSSLINSCQFRKLWTDGDGGDWSVEFGTYSTDMVASINRCINFVMTATDQEFHDNIGEYFDLYSLLDYYCFSYLVCHLDGLAKNMLMATYDGVIWGACLYDMDSIYGVHWNGNSYVATNYQCPEQYQEQFSLLWQRIERCFATELYARYRELRQGALSLTNIVKHVEEIYDVIPDRVFADEKAKWTSLPQVNTNTMTRFRNYMRDRAVYVDAQMEEIGAKVPCTGIVLSADTLSFTTTDTQTLSVVVSPENTTDTVNWSVSPSGIATVNNGVITPISNGECTITATCGSYSATCAVTVALPVVECTGITLDKHELVISPSTSEQPSEETIDITQNVTNGSLIRGAWAIGVNGGMSNFGNVKTNEGDRATDFIPFTSNNTLTISQPSSTYGCGLVAYDSNKQAIACYTTNNTWEVGNTQSSVDVTTLTVNVTTPPANTAYVRICFNLTSLSGVTVVKKSTNNSVGSYQLTATVTPDNCTQPVVWSVLPEGIVTVDNGLVTAVTNGEATVTATCSIQSATCAVTVSGMSESGGDSDVSDGYMSYMIQYQSEPICTFALHTASTSTDCQGFECSPFFNGFAFPTDTRDTDTSYMICDGMPTVTDGEKKVNNIPCIAGATNGAKNYLTVKVLKTDASTLDEFKTYFRENPTYIKIKPKDTVHKYSIDINNIEMLNTSHTNSGYTCGEFIVNDLPTTNYTASNVFMSNLGHSDDWSSTCDWSYFKISEWQGNVYVGFQIKNELLETQDLEGIRKYIAKDPNIYYIN